MIRFELIGSVDPILRADFERNDILYYEVALNTGHTGFFGTMVESVTSGEGIVLKFSGEGKVIVCSRNRQAFLDWILRRVPKPTVS